MNVIEIGVGAESHVEPMPCLMLTGASGFIGAAFLKLALAQGWRVRVLTRKPSEWTAQDGLDVFEGDLAYTPDWTQALQGVQVVVHAAAEIKDADLMSVVNVQGPMRLLDAAIQSGVKRWVQLSSVGAYGPVQDGVVTEDCPDRPAGPYEVSKTDLDVALMQATQRSGIEVCIVRPSNVYGPNMRNQSIHQLMNTIRKGLFAYIGPPGASANYVHVDDVVQALALCMVNPKAANQTYIVSAWASMEDMVNALAKGAGLRPPTRRMNLRVVTWLAVALHKWPRWPLTLSRVHAMSLRSRYSTQKIEDELGWKLTVPVQDGMSQLAKVTTT